jgi:3-oxoadipate enol-lactonase
MSSFLDTPLGYKIHYISFGDSTGQIVICMHGLGGSTTTFETFIPLLSPTCSVVSVDFPGFGKSPLPTGPDAPRISVADHVANIHHLVASLQAAAPAGSAAATKPVLLVGHSLGAIVSLQAAATTTAKFGGLLLLGPGRAGSRIPPARAAMLDMAALVRTEGISAAATKAEVTNFYADTPERTVPPELKKAVYDAVAASDPEGYAQTCEAIVADDHVDPDYSAIKCPVVFVAGDKDMISPVSRSEDLAKLVGGPTEVQIVRSGHQPILEDLEGVKLALSIFLNNVEKAGA